MCKIRVGRNIYIVNLSTNHVKLFMQLNHTDVYSSYMRHLLSSYFTWLAKCTLVYHFKTYSITISASRAVINQMKHQVPAFISSWYNNYITASAFCGVRSFLPDSRPAVRHVNLCTLTKTGNGTSPPLHPPTPPLFISALHYPDFPTYPLEAPACSMETRADKEGLTGPSALNQITLLLDGNLLHKTISSTELLHWKCRTFLSARKSNLRITHYHVFYWCFC